MQHNYYSSDLSNLASQLQHYKASIASSAFCVIDKEISKWLAMYDPVVISIDTVFTKAIDVRQGFYLSISNVDRMFEIGEEDNTVMYRDLDNWLRGYNHVDLPEVIHHMLHHYSFWGGHVKIRSAAHPLEKND